MGRGNLRQTAEIERLTLSLREAARKTARTQAPREDAQNALKPLELRCRGNVSKRCRIRRSYSSGYRTHGWRETSESTLRDFSIASAVSSSASGFFSSDGWKPLCKKKNKHNLEEQEKYLLPCQPEGSFHTTVPTAIHHHYKLISNRRTTVSANSGRRTLYKTVVLPKKTEVESIEFVNFANSTTFVLWKMNFKSEVLLQLKFFQQKLWCGSMNTIPPGLWTN